MPWNPIWPVQNVSVKNNGPTGRENTAYTQTTMNIDHYWQVGVDEDGHHKWAQMVATNDADKTLQTNAVLATGMDLVYYNRFKTALESVAQQDSQPYVKNQGAIAPFPQAVMQLLGIRAMAVWNIVAGPDPTLQTIVYNHNVDEVSRGETGIYTISYLNPLPSDNYLVIGSAMALTGNATFTPMILSVSSGASVGARKSTAGMVILTHLGNQGNPAADALQGWFICFGG